jgi:hypothetical protein
MALCPDAMAVVGHDDLSMRLMADGRWVGVRCDRCGRTAVSDQDLHKTLGAESWFHHARLVNRHVCAACLEGLPPAQRAEYVGVAASEPDRLGRIPRSVLPPLL